MSERTGKIRRWSDRRLCRDLSRVGRDRTIGYLPNSTIRKFLKVAAAIIEAKAASRGLSVRVFGPKDCCIGSGALYVYDAPALARILEENGRAVRSSGCSIEPDAFVAEIARTWFEANEPVVTVIAMAFGDI